MHPSRRTFVLSAGSALTAARVWSANDRIPLGVIGLGGRGRDHLNEYTELPECEVVAVCDVNQAARERAVAVVQKKTGSAPRQFKDMREMFDDKSVAAVSIATPNHWHALSTIWACQAGKDVYVEKPASHNIYEGRKMVEAARKYNRMVQVGSQSRTIAHKRRAMQLLHEGILGRLYMARGLCYRLRQSIGIKADAPVPPGLDWDLFLGPAPMRPYNENRFAYNWHWFWDTGSGDIGNQGVHEMDIALWGMGLSLPNFVASTGGRYHWNDQGETPNTQTSTYEYGDRQIVFEVRNLLTNSEGGIPIAGGSVVGNMFYGTDGVMVVHPGGFQVYKGDKREKTLDESPQEARIWDPRPHMANFLKAVRSRRKEDLNAEIEVGAAAAAMCHLGNISYRLGRRIHFDPDAMRFWDDSMSDRLVTREYRKPYVVPEKV
jgi:predicted dehydrogenase